MGFLNFHCFPIIKSMYSLYNLKKVGRARFSTGKLWIYGSGLVYSHYRTYQKNRTPPWMLAKWDALLGEEAASACPTGPCMQERREGLEAFQTSLKRRSRRTLADKSGNMFDFCGNTSSNRAGAWSDNELALIFLTTQQSISFSMSARKSPIAASGATNVKNVIRFFRQCTFTLYLIVCTGIISSQ